MTARNLTDAAGQSIPVVDVDGFIVPSLMPDKTAEQSKQQFEHIPNFKCRDDDVFLLSYPKTGTNWLNEIIMMLLNKSTEKPVINKVMAMLEFQTQETVDTISSPRCLNTHVQYKYIPKEIKEKQLRTVLVARNPKDTLVSFFNHVGGIRSWDYNGVWKDWFQLYMKGEIMFGMYTDYLKGFEKAMAEGIGFPFHMLYYENMKLNGQEEVEKLAKFLGVDADEELLKDIVDKCGFETMAKKKAAQSEIKKNAFKEGFKFYRKGQIGDWMNWFTVAQNEQFDQYWEKEMKDSKLKFIYT